MSATAVIILRRKRFIRRFREAGATAPERAIPFSEVDMRRSWVFNQMLSRGVFPEAGPDRYYVDERAADAFPVAQRRRALTVVGVLLAYPSGRHFRAGAAPGRQPASTLRVVRASIQVPRR